MDVTIWTKFDRNPVILRAIDAKAAMMFEKQISAQESDYATIHTVDGFSLIRLDNILSVHFLTGTVRKEGGGDNGTV